MYDGTNIITDFRKNYLHRPAPFQFGLRGLLLATTVACVTAAAWRIIGWPAVFVGLTAVMVAIACRGCDARNRHRRTRWAVVVGLAPLAHAFFAGYAHDNLGWIPSLFAHATLVLYWPIVVLYLAGRHRLSADLAVLLALLLVVPQAIWTTRLPILRHEVERIIAFAEDARQRSGEYPGHLDGYQWTSASLQPYIEYGLGTHDEPIIYYRSVAFSEPHWYSPRSGWGYTPD